MRNILTSTSALATLAMVAYAADDSKATGTASAETVDTTGMQAETEQGTEQTGDAAMNENPDGPLGYLADKTKIKAIHDALGCGGSTRRIVDSLEEAVNIIDEAGKKTNMFAGLPVEIAEGAEFDGKRVVIATLGTRLKEGPNAGTNAIKAILVFPQPTVDSFLADAREFVAKLVEREATDTQFGQLRSAATLNELRQYLKQIPVDVAEVISSSQSSAMDTSAFDDFWTTFRGIFLKQYPKFEPFIPGKPIVLKALRSASYAAANPATKELEGKGYWVKIGGMFVTALKGMTDKEGKPMNLDTSTIESWLADRETTKLTYNDGATPSADALEL